MVSSNINFINYIGSALCSIGVACNGEYNESQGLARINLLDNAKDADKAEKFVHSVLRCEDRTGEALCNHFLKTPNILS